MARRHDKQPQKSRVEKHILASVVGSTAFEEYVDFIQSPWKAFFYGFLRGTGFTFGTIIGVALVVTLFAYIVQLFSGVPVLGQLLIRIAQIAHIQ